MKKFDFGDFQILIPEDENKIGIENTKKVANYIVQLHARAKKVMEDNKVTWLEALGSLGYVKGLFNIINLGPILNEERKDYTASELAEVYAILDDGIGLNDRVDTYFEEGLAILDSLNSFARTYG